jgi:hypothetical protein
MRSCGKLELGYPPRQFPLVRRCITSVTPRLVRIRHIVGSKFQWQSAFKCRVKAGVTYIQSRRLRKVRRSQESAGVPYTGTIARIVDERLLAKDFFYMIKVELRH